jgi:uncharacterized membrane protein YqiK
MDFTDSMGWQAILVLAGIALAALFLILFIISRLYTRASKEISWVRTGFGGQKVIVNGGALVFPVFHELIPVNMNTLKLDVQRAKDQALITRDRMRVDVQAEFFVRVQPTEEAIANAAQTLGRKTMEPEQLKDLIEAKFVDSLRSVAAEMGMEELHEARTQFVQKVQQAVSEDLLKNGLELESVSLTGLNQTNKEYFNPDNAFDAEGLLKLTEAIEQRRKLRNDIQQDTEVEIQKKNLEAVQQQLALAREVEYAKLEQQREIEIRKAQQQSEIESQQAEKQREAETAKIAAQQQLDQSRLVAERAVAEQRIAMEQQLKERDVVKQKMVELAEQDRAIAIAEKSKSQSDAQAAADAARAAAVRAAEQVVTAAEIEKAERQKRIELVEAAKEAERKQIAITIAAQAEKQAAEEKAEAMRTLANAAADQKRTEAEAAATAEKLKAEAEATAEKLKADAAAARYDVDAAGQRALNDAANTLSAEQIAMQVRLAILKHLPDIIRESVKPMERIDDIKIVQVDGLTGAGGGAPGGAGNAAGEGAGSGNLAEQVVSSALRYRAQAPLIDGLMQELGLHGRDLAGLAAGAATADGDDWRARKLEELTRRRDEPKKT